MGPTRQIPQESRENFYQVGHNYVKQFENKSSLLNKCKLCKKPGDFFLLQNNRNFLDFYELARSFDIEIVTDADVIVALTVLHDKSQR